MRNGGTAIDTTVGSPKNSSISTRNSLLLLNAFIHRQCRITLESSAGMGVKKIQPVPYSAYTCRRLLPYARFNRRGLTCQLKSHERGKEDVPKSQLKSHEREKEDIPCVRLHLPPREGKPVSPSQQEEDLNMATKRLKNRATQFKRYYTQGERVVRNSAVHANSRTFPAPLTLPMSLSSSAVEPWACEAPPPKKASGMTDEWWCEIFHSPSS